MPRSKSVLKRQRQNARRAVHNKGIRSRIKTMERRVRQATTPEEAEQRFQEFQKGIDKAAAKGVIHPNKAARRKARVAKALQTDASASS